MKQIIIFLLFPVCLLACKNNATEPVAVKSPVVVAQDIVQLSPVQVKNAGIETGTPENREMQRSLQVNGVVDVPPGNIVSISIPLGGYVKKTTLMEGSKINKGSVLAIIEDQQYIQLQQDYLTGKIKLEFLEADFNRQKNLNQTKITSDKVFQQSKSDYESQKVIVRSLSEKLRLTGINPESLNENNISRSITIYSPINGYVTKVNVNNGKYVSPSDVLFELINPVDLHIALTVFENDASSLAIGQKVICSTNSLPGEKITASIHLITPNIGEDRATEVHCHLDDHNKKLFPGTFINATIALDNKRVPAVPEDAIVKWENKYYLFVEEKEGSFRFTPVETGATYDGYTEIKSVLEGKNIVIKNAYSILMKMKNSAEEG